MAPALAPVFIDPRADPAPDAGAPRRPPADAPDDLAPLLDACRTGRLYEVEAWIAAGRPLQAAEAGRRSRRRPTTPLAIALHRGDHALTRLLLCNGYDAALEPEPPLDAALAVRRLDLVGLLLDWGACPHRVDLERLFESYDSALFERFYALGVDLTARHALARALGVHTSNKPLYGFAKRHAARDPAVARALSAALAHHAHHANAKGVELCLWAGADLHAPTDYLPPYDVLNDDEPDDETPYAYTALRAACSGGHAHVVDRLGIDPQRDDLDDLYHVAYNGAVVDALARHALPTDASAVVVRRIESAAWEFGNGDAAGALRRLFAHGARWEHASAETLRDLRRRLLSLPGNAFRAIVLALATPDACAPDVLHELGRTPAFERRLADLGLLPQNRAWVLRTHADDTKAVLLAFRPASREAQQVRAKALRMATGRED